MLFSPPDIALVLGIALLVFGPKRLPELGQALGQGIGKFKKGLADAETAIRTEVATASSVPLAKPESHQADAAVPGDSAAEAPQSIKKG